jgi:hypothetical protein
MKLRGSQKRFKMTQEIEKRGTLILHKTKGYEMRHCMKVKKRCQPASRNSRRRDWRIIEKIGDSRYNGECKEGRIMYVVEFQSKISNGVIQIPAQYIGKINEEVKVILLSKEKKEKKDRFSIVEIDTKEFKFNREEANAR